MKRLDRETFRVYLKQEKHLNEPFRQHSRTRGSNHIIYSYVCMCMCMFSMFVVDIIIYLTVQIDASIYELSGKNRHRQAPFFVTHYTGSSMPLE